MALRIEDYAIIGNCQSAALVGRDGSIDWLCLPRFDSGACFASLLGTPEHGRWLLGPSSDVRQTSRRYLGDTLILETDFETDSGLVTLVDCMPLGTPRPNIVRQIVGRRGTVPMRLELVIRFDYGSLVPWVHRTNEGLMAIAGPDTLNLESDVPLHGENLKTVGEFVVTEGQTVSFVLTWRPSHEGPLPFLDPGSAVRATEKWWQVWSSRCTYKGEWRDAVVRSLITLKALTYAPTGGIVAAPTTSLPEFIGGPRNWDYRFCWLRDAAFTLFALLQSGYHEEALAWRDWLLRAVAGKASQLNILYGVAGERRLPELTLPWLPGYESSRPVRIGNAAHEQFQLDVFGEVMGVLHLDRREGTRETDHSWDVQRELLDFLEAHWNDPDEGIWEVRGPRRHFTHSKVMAWVAFDRAVKDCQHFKLEGPIDRWRQARDSLHAEICQKGFDPQQNSFVQSYGSIQLDASLLMLAMVRFLPPHDARIRGTVEAIERHLLRNGFVQRYISESGVDGLPPGEGAFLPCTFWLAENYALLGRHDDARRLFESVLAIRSDLGLLAEEYDPIARRMLGNFPQAFSHLGLVNTAIRLRALTPVDASH